MSRMRWEMFIEKRRWIIGIKNYPRETHLKWVVLVMIFMLNLGYLRGDLVTFWRVWGVMLAISNLFLNFWWFLEVFWGFVDQFLNLFKQIVIEYLPNPFQIPKTHLKPHQIPPKIQQKFSKIPSTTNQNSILPISAAVAWFIAPHNNIANYFSFFLIAFHFLLSQSTNLLNCNARRNIFIWDFMNLKFTSYTFEIAYNSHVGCWLILDADDGDSIKLAFYLNGKIVV